MPEFDLDEDDSELEPPTLMGLTRQNAIQPVSVSFLNSNLPYLNSFFHYQMARGPSLNRDSTNTIQRQTSQALFDAFNQEDTDFDLDNIEFD